MNNRFGLLSVAVGLSIVPALAGADTTTGSTGVRITTGVEYATGDYGGTATVDEVYAPVTLTLSRGRIGARLTVPYLSVDGPVDALYAEAVGDGASGALEDSHESGLGDVVGSLTVFDVISSNRLGIAVDLTGKVKFGTADADTGLGTGENDYSMLVDVYKFFDRAALVGTIGYKLRGEPVGVTLDDVLIGSVGSLCDCWPKSRLGVFYDYREASLPAAEDVREVALYGSRDLNRAWRVQYYVFKGFSDSGPDWGIGLQLGVNLPEYFSQRRD